MIELLPIGSRVRCACPRFLIAERISGHINRRLPQILVRDLQLLESRGAGAGGKRRRGAGS